MKKVISLLLVAVFMFSAISVSAADFFDLTPDHWAYEAVQYVASKGVINGYEDGSFRPSNVVTRAEFVKLIGEGPVVRETPFDDVDESHWGYKYIMSSGMEVTDNKFLPDQPILRGEVIDLLWARNGKPVASASPAVSGQWSNPKSVAWAYSTGLMIGDDGVNLRLNDTLTRAEAATLIQRSEGLTVGVNTLKSHVSDDTMLLVLNGTGLLDDVQTDMNAPITNIELAKAIVRYEFGENNPVITEYPRDAVNTPEGKTWGYVANNYLGSEEYSEEKMYAQATLSDALAGLTGAAMRTDKNSKKFSRDKEGYAGITATGAKDMYLKVAKGSGVEFEGEQPLTVGNFAYLVFQFDRFVGTKISYKNSRASNESVEMHKNDYPTNASEYPAILENIPKHIYEVPFAVEGEFDYDFAREYHDVFHGALSRFAQNKSVKACRVQFTYYPSLVKKCGDERYVMRVKMTLTGDIS
ncbi:MAG: S-layer homology domain-containing protein, partial [Clostridia bacterium]|nr:S-layer homology domain-containing protein [Clostridia bacterium]